MRFAVFLVIFLLCSLHGTQGASRQSGGASDTLGSEFPTSPVSSKSSRFATAEDMCREFGVSKAAAACGVAQRFPCDSNCMTIQVVFKGSLAKHKKAQVFLVHSRFKYVHYKPESVTKILKGNPLHCVFEAMKEDGRLDKIHFPEIEKKESAVSMFEEWPRSCWLRYYGDSYYILPNHPMYGWFVENLTQISNVLQRGEGKEEFSSAMSLDDDDKAAASAAPVPLCVMPPGEASSAPKPASAIPPGSPASSPAVAASAAAIAVDQGNVRGAGSNTLNSMQGRAPQVPGVSAAPSSPRATDAGDDGWQQIDLVPASQTA